VIFFQVGRHEKCLRGVPSARRGAIEAKGADAKSNRLGRGGWSGVSKGERGKEKDEGKKFHP